MIVSKKFLVLSTLLVFSPITRSDFLRVSGKNFYYGNTNIFLSGVNLPRTTWDCYGCDWGNNNYNKPDGTRKVLENYISRLSSMGGNSMRIWLHAEGEYTPLFDDTGYVVGTDGPKTLISDLSSFLDFAASKNVFIIICLWNGARMTNQKMQNLVWDDSKLTTYINKALVPMVQALKNKPALGAWEVMNEPEGAISTQEDKEPCYDTSRLSNTGAGWSGVKIPMDKMSRFVARQVAAIHQNDPKALVTVGSFSDRPQTDAFDDAYNYYKDECMIKAAGSKDAKLDFFQMHTYAYPMNKNGKWAPHSPFKVKADAFKLDRPLVVGEFASECSESSTSEKMFDYVYNNGYKGAWSWQYQQGDGGECADNQETQERGLKKIRNYRQNGVIGVIINNRRRTDAKCAD